MWKVLAPCLRVRETGSKRERARETWTVTAPGLYCFALIFTPVCVCSCMTHKHCAVGVCMFVCCDWDQTDEALVYLSGTVWGLEEQASGSQWPYISITLDGHHCGQLFILISSHVGYPKQAFTAFPIAKSTAIQFKPVQSRRFQKYVGVILFFYRLVDAYFNLHRKGTESRQESVIGKNQY